jgi:hypothetical protein
MSTVWILNLLTLDKERNATDVHSWFLLKNTRLPVFNCWCIYCALHISFCPIPTYFGNLKALLILTLVCHEYSIVFSLRNHNCNIINIFARRYPLSLHVRSLLQDTEVQAAKVVNTGVVLEHKGSKRNTQRKLYQTWFIK